MKQLLPAAALLLALSSAHATTIFSDDFSGNTVGGNLIPNGWTVLPGTGTVDIIGPGWYDLLPGNGPHIDLDGSTTNAGVLSKSLLLTAGVQYIASFQLAGNQRGWPSDTVDVSFGTTQGSYTLASSQGLTTYTLAFTASTTGNYSLSFANQGGDNYGALLDNVSVAAVPEPQSLALGLAGLACAAVALRRQRRA
ncbi:MAG: DUF642 domain-containing protein [Pseudomonadota bacterium]